MLAPTDFTCTIRAGVPTCQASTPVAVAAVRALQQRLIQLLPELGRAGFALPPGSARLTVDGRVGPTTAFAARALLGALAGVVGAAMPDLDAAPADLISSIALHADDTLAFIDQVLLAVPDAMSRPPTKPMAPAPPPGLRGDVKPRAIGGLAALAGVLGGFGLLVWGASRKTSGRSDNSGFFDEDPDVKAEETRGPRWADLELPAAPAVTIDHDAE